MAQPVPSTQTVLDLLGLAFARSALRDGLTRELLAEKLEPAWDTVFKNNVLYLERVWQIAKQRDDFNAKQAMVPLCFIKTQERRLGVMVELPADMKHLSATDQSTHAALCPVKREELDQILGPLGRTRTPVEGSSPEAASSRRMTPVPSGKTPVPKLRESQSAPFAPPPVEAVKAAPDRRLRAMIAGVLGLLAVGFLSVSVSRSCGEKPRWETIGTEDFKGIPVREPQRLGNQVVATLSDEKWLDQPEETRRQQLLAVLDGMSKRKVDVVALKVGTRVRASAQYGGTPRRAVVKFPR